MVTILQVRNWVLWLIWDSMGLYGLYMIYIFFQPLKKDVHHPTVLVGDPAGRFKHETTIYPEIPLVNQ